LLSPILAIFEGINTLYTPCIRPCLRY